MKLLNKALIAGLVTVLSTPVILASESTTKTTTAPAAATAPAASTSTESMGNKDKMKHHRMNKHHKKAEKAAAEKTEGANTSTSTAQ